MNRELIRPLGIALIFIMIVGIVPLITAPKAEAAPTLTNLQSAIYYGYQGLKKLYKGESYMGSDYSADSEYFGAPIKVQRISDLKWTLAGETDSFNGINIISIASTTEEFDYLFVYGGSGNNPLINVKLEYAYTSTQVRVTVTCKDVSTSQTFRVRLYDTAISFSGNEVCSTAREGTYGTWMGDSSNPSQLKSFRYTIRHGNMLGYKDARVFGNENDMEWNLSHLANAMGFGVDFYDPLYHYDWNKEMGWATEAYWHDCAAWGSMPTGMTSGASYYPYYSKICMFNLPPFLYGWQGYAAAISLDPLGYAIKALDALHLYHNPDTVISPNYPYTIRDHARYIEANWWWSGVGVRGVYMPFGNWPSSYASSVRSASFLALEATLGYKYGDTTSQSYADQMADIFVNTMGSGGIRVPSTGVVQTEEHGAVTRKQYAYLWPVAWNSLKQVAPKGWVQQLGDMAQEELYIRKEFAGVAVSNAESVDTILRSLEVYLEFKYPTGSYTTSGRPNHFAEVEFFNTGSTRKDRSFYFSITTTRTFYVWTRNFNDPYSRYVTFYIDGVQKAQWVCGAGYTTCYNSWSGSVSAGTRNIGLVITTYDTGTPDSWWVGTIFRTSTTLALGSQDQVIIPGGIQPLTAQEQAALLAQNATIPVLPG